MADVRPTKRRRRRRLRRPNYGQKRTRGSEEESTLQEEAKRHRPQYVLRMTKGKGFMVEEDKSKPFPISTIRIEEVHSQVFSHDPLPRFETTCWTVRVHKHEIFMFMFPPFMGVSSNSGHPGSTMTSVGWSPMTRTKDTYNDDRKINSVTEPGLDTYYPGAPIMWNYCDVNIFHFKFDPITLKLHLRLGCYPNMHLTIPLDAGIEYWVCFLHCTHTMEVWKTASW